MLWPWITELRLLADTGISDAHQPYFASAGAQEGYFLSKTALDLGNTYTQLNSELPIRVNADYEKLLKVDMLTCINHNLGDKRLYFRVVSKHWINTNCTELHVVFDAFQTFMHDIEFKQCFVEREMQSEDWNGSIPSFNNLANEGHSIGDYVLASRSVDSLGPTTYVMAMACDSDGRPVNMQVVDGIFAGCRYVEDQNGTELNELIAAYSDKGKLEGILGIMAVPQQVYTNHGQEIVRTAPANLTTWYDGYVPKNAKCFTAPYNVIRLNTPNSGDTILQYEYFADPLNIQFGRKCSFSMQAAAITYPKWYKHVENNYDEALTMTDFPQCSFVGNGFANWLAQNKGRQSAAIIGGMVGMATGVATANPAIVAAASGTLVSTAASVVDKSVYQGSSKGSIGANTANQVWGLMVFNIDQVQCHTDLIRRIDDYFSAFGYNTGALKTPNLRTRPFWNYVKTRNACIGGTIAKEWQDQITSLFNKGITLWHVDNGAIIGDYSMDNRE